jgi:excisionase family DNA binding protein
MTSSVSLKSLAETARILGVSYFTVRRLVIAGHITAVNVGARIMVSESEIVRVTSHGTGTRRTSKVVNAAAAR